MDNLGIKKIEIITVAKVASSLFLYSLQPKHSVAHGHSLLRLREILNQESDTLIISGIRNPLDRNISYFFQTYADDFYNEVKTKHNNYQGEYCYICSPQELVSKDTDQLIELFFQQSNHDTFNQWFEEFFEITGLNSEPYNKEIGWKLYSRSNNNYILFYTFEKIESLKLHILNFFQISTVLHTNNSSDRLYKNKYTQFKALIEFDSQYKSRLLDTEVMQYFYTDTEINSFRQSKSLVSNMTFYDFIEIGTSDFDTEIQKADNNIKGISIDPVKFYLDRLPQPASCIKYNVAVSDKNGKVKVYYVPADVIAQYNLPDCIRGCNSINSYHSGVCKILNDRNLPIDKLFVSEEVKMVTIEYLVEKFKIIGIHLLKIDTEGHDTVILNNYCQLVSQRPELKAHKIIFESNILTNRADLTNTLMKLLDLGYQLESSLDDTIIKLPLSKTVQPRGLPNYYIAGYPQDYDPNNPPHDQTLESTLKYAQKIKAGGVTLEDGRYTVRANTDLYYFNKPGLRSWPIN